MANEPRRRNIRSKYWLLTIWPPRGDYTPGECERFFESRATFEYVQFVRWQLERAPDTGRLHIQAVIQWKSLEGKTALTTRLGIPNRHYHAEPITYNFESAPDYASKVDTRVGDTAYEYGEYSTPRVDEGGQLRRGARNDLEFAGQFLERGGTVAELAPIRPDLVIKYAKGLETTERYLRERSAPGRQRTGQRKVFVLVGPTGTGKTSGVYLHYEDKSVFSPPVRQGQALWFDGLAGQKVVVFDEFHGDVPFQSLKRFVDPWHNEMAPIKGTHAKLTADVVFIISNQMPYQWWPWKEFGADQFPELARRVTAWVWFGSEDPIQSVGWPAINWVKKADFDWGVGCLPCPHRHQ